MCSAWVSDRQKAHAMIRSFEFSASFLHSPTKGEGIKTELIIGHTSVSKYGEHKFLVSMNIVTVKKCMVDFLGTFFQSSCLNTGDTIL